jgi:hypothetical protein
MEIAGNEWLVYCLERDDRSIQTGQCSRNQCSLDPVVIKYSSIREAGNPEFLCEPHARNSGWSGKALVLGEAELSALLRMSGDASTYDEDYHAFEEGSAVTFWTEAIDYHPLRAFRLRIDAIINGHLELDEYAGDPPSRPFEATVLRSTNDSYAVGKKVCGIIFPNGFASVFSDSPNSNHADRAIAAMLILLDSESPN